MRTSSVMIVSAFLALCFLRVPAAYGVEAVALPPQVPPRTASGATNITDVWLHGGGGRLYWNTLVTPRQIALDGARFADPAAVPELAVTPKPARKTHTRRASRRVKVSKAAPHAATDPAPKGVGKTALLPPDKNSAVPPLTSPAAAASGQAGATVPARPSRPDAVASGGMPYSSLPASSVGGISGAAASNPPLPDVPQPPSVSPDSVQPNPGARP